MPRKTPFASITAIVGKDFIDSSVTKGSSLETLNTGKVYFSWNFFILFSYCPDHLEGIPAELEKGFPALAVVKITPEFITGKQCIELVK